MSCELKSVLVQLFIQLGFQWEGLDWIDSVSRQNPRHGRLFTLYLYVKHTMLSRCEFPVLVQYLYMDKRLGTIMMKYGEQQSYVLSRGVTPSKFEME
jgi:hypothetical protein